MDALSYFENSIYLPMLIIILDRDREVIEVSSLKFKDPYWGMIEPAIKLGQIDLNNTNDYLRKKQNGTNQEG